MDDQTKQLAELKKIADIKFDRERHRLSAVKEELSRLESERKALGKKMVGIAEAKETNPSSMINAMAYLNALENKAKNLDAARREASQRTMAQREKIKTALAAKIRVDGMSEE